MSTPDPSPLDTLATKTILFLTTPEYSHAPSISDPYSTPATIATLPVPNRRLAEALALAGADVRFSSWRFPAAGSTRATLCRFDVVTFLCCDGYYGGGGGDGGGGDGGCRREEFLRFLDQTLIPLQEAVGRLKVVNGAAVVRWAVGLGQGEGGREGGLREFEGVGFRVRVRKGLGREERVDGEEEGEFGLVFLGGGFSHAVLMKRRRKARAPDGADGRGSSLEEDGNGGEVVEIGRGELPRDAVEIGERLHAWLEGKFGRGSVGYMRLDGVAAEGGDGGGFVITGLELVEPEIWIAEKQGGLERFVRCLLDE